MVCWLNMHICVLVVSLVVVSVYVCVCSILHMCVRCVRYYLFCCFFSCFSVTHHTSSCKRGRHIIIFIVIVHKRYFVSKKFICDRLYFLLSTPTMHTKAILVPWLFLISCVTAVRLPHFTVISDTILYTMYLLLYLGHCNK